MPSRSKIQYTYVHFHLIINQLTRIPFLKGNHQYSRQLTWKLQVYARSSLGMSLRFFDVAFFILNVN